MDRVPDNHIYAVHDFPFTDVDGSKLILEMGIDITERKQAEAQLRLQTSAMAGGCQRHPASLTVKAPSSGAIRLLPG